MNVHVSAPFTVCSGLVGHWNPWNSRPISLFMATVHLGPAVDRISSRYSAALPVSGLMAAALYSGHGVDGPGWTEDTCVSVWVSICW